MSGLLEALKTRLVIGDGAMGTQLQAHGLEVRECPELWNVTHPDDIRAIHRDYIEAGAEVVLTNTFGCSRFKLERFKFEGRVAELNEAGAKVARAAAGKEHFVLGDVGSTGELVYPLGLHKEEAFVEVFKEQIEALVRGGVDGIIIETMTDLDEASAAVKAARKVTDLPVLVSMQFKRDADGVGLHTVMGVDVAAYAERMKALGVDVIGGNCSSPEELVDVVRLLKENCDLPVLAEPNAGVPQLIKWKTVFALGPEDYAKAVSGVVENGVNFLGGCCGTTPGHVREMARRFTKR